MINDVVTDIGNGGDIGTTDIFEGIDLSKSYYDRATLLTLIYNNSDRYHISLEPLDTGNNPYVCIFLNIKIQKDSNGNKTRAIPSLVEVRSIDELRTWTGKKYQVINRKENSELIIPYQHEKSLPFAIMDNEFTENLEECISNLSDGSIEYERGRKIRAYLYSFNPVLPEIIERVSHMNSDAKPCPRVLMQFKHWTKTDLRDYEHYFSRPFLA